MLKKILLNGCILIMGAMLISCSSAEKKVKIGVSFGVGEASRWENEKVYMEERAKELGADIEVRLNKTDKPKTQQEDCYEMIDSGIDVLILTPRDVKNVQEIMEYASSRDVKVINYARVALGQPMDLFVGYDSGRIGQTLGQYLVETVDKGDYIVLKGDPGDNNASLLYNGAMKYITPMEGDINILLDGAVAGWSPDEARKMVSEALKANGSKVDAILAPNDKIAGACAEALEELGVTDHVAITGMDAELDAVRRIVSGTQDVTIYMDLKELAHTAIDEACKMGRGQEPDVNTKFDNETETGVDAYLITGRLITKQNIDKLLIEPGYFTKEEVYGEE